MPTLKNEAFFPSPSVCTLLNVALEPRTQEVEIASSLQIPAFQIIGLPGPEVSEAKDRIRAAIESTDFEFPRRKLVLNLSPASVRKQGTGLDLAMAIATLIEGLRIEGFSTALFPHRRFFAWGELGLGGQVKAVGSPTRAIASAISGRAECMIVSRDEVATFLEVRDRLFPESQEKLSLIGVAHLSEVLFYLRTGTIDGPPPAAARPGLEASGKSRDTRSLLSLPSGLERTLRIAATGGHHFLLLGPKGVGKSHALEWFLAMLPELDLETTRMRSFLGEMSGKSCEAPYRRVGTQAKPASLLGSFSTGALRPGELSLAHGGVLLADEFPEWSRDAREALREPLERRKLSLTRVDGAVELPCDFIFAGNGNLCPCGGIPEAPTDESQFACRCHPVDRLRYLSRLSGPILDRLDIVSLLRKVPAMTDTVENVKASPADRLAQLREEIALGRQALRGTFGSLPGKMEAFELEEILQIAPELREALDRLRFRSFRDRHKTFRLALTLAALQGCSLPSERHLLEARAMRTEADSLFRPA
jgi:magnesium chelatase family protein